MDTAQTCLGCKKRVLIVENDESVQQVLRQTLEDVGFEARTMWSGYEALALLKAQALDVLVVDDYLPDLHFHDFLKRAGDLPVQPRIVVMQAAAPTAEDLRQYALLGASSVVRKYDIDELCKVVSSVASTIRWPRFA